MDTIKLYGGEPANFLDVGGGTTESDDDVQDLLKNLNLKAILVNIFGGIMKQTPSPKAWSQHPKP